MHPSTLSHLEVDCRRSRNSLERFRAAFKSFTDAIAVLPKGCDTACYDLRLHPADYSRISGFGTAGISKSYWYVARSPNAEVGGCHLHDCQELSGSRSRADMFILYYQSISTIYIVSITNNRKPGNLDGGPRWILISKGRALTAM